ncbi:MAG: glycoside hydrolase family 2 TIM barrel-domain containing protein [Desulfuromonadaceae bacterium]
MPESDHIYHLKGLFIVMALLLLTGSVTHATAQESAVAATVKTYQDNSGWKLLVNGESYFVKGVVWGYTPIGENYAYNLWSKPDDDIKKVLDYDCALMKAAGINTIRSFFNTPPRWIEYIYTKYGIMTIVNHLAGRYGVKVDGSWRSQTDYSDPRTREAIKKEVLEQVVKFKNTPGVLMIALGNENNYGLEWSSNFEIENLPSGERQAVKAKFLYSMYNEIIAEGKKIDRDRLFTIVNGDIQYIDLIAEQCKEIDLLGVNSYRGKSFTSLWKDTKEKLNKPIVFMEFGSDAFNSKTNQEDQAAQAEILKANWQEIYSKSYGNGAEGNALGGTVFEWRDEWWKYLQTENLLIHDKNASWSNGGYSFDYVAGENNMNEEWYGIVALERPNDVGVSEARPRMAYYTLQKIFQIDPYRQDLKTINSSFERIDMSSLAYESDLRSLKQTQTQNKSLYLAGGNVRMDFVSNAKDKDIRENGKEAQNYSQGVMGFLDFGFQPSSKLTGDFSVNYINTIPDRVLEEFYGKTRNKNSIELYNFNSTLKTDAADITTFYHTPRYHWGYEGDFYGLLKETTDIKGIDIWDSKAPIGVEFAGKKELEGLKVLLGPEVYWGANPKIMAKYNFGTGHYKFSIMHSEDIAKASTSATNSAIEKASRATTFSVKSTVIPKTIIEIGAIAAASEKIDDRYTYLDNGNIGYGKIEFADTLGAKAKITHTLTDSLLVYAGVNYAGLVADGGDPLKEFDTLLPYSKYGNKIEADGGVRIAMGEYYTLFPRVLWRDNLKAANPSIAASTTGNSLYPGLTPRNRDSDPFAVLDNRKALAWELFFTYDPTPATDFYNWDNKNREDAPFAFNVGFNYTDYNTPTDSYTFYFKEGNTNAAFPAGLSEARAWKALSRMVFNPKPWLRIANKVEVGHQQSTGAAGPARTYYSTEFDFDFYKRHLVSGYIKKDQWGPYDYYQQFNVTFPWQYSLDYMYRIDHLLQKYVPARLGKSAGIGITGIVRTYDQNSPPSDYMNGKNDYSYQINTYLTYEF